MDSFEEKPGGLQAAPSTLTRIDMLGKDIDSRANWYRGLHFRHREMMKVAAGLSHLLHPTSEPSIAAIIGPTGIGKTLLANIVLGPQLRQVWKSYLQPSDVPVLHLEAPANGERSFSWRTLYRRLLTSGAEEFIDKKISTTTADGYVRVNRGRGTVAALRESVESMIRHRNVRLIVIDEAVHLLRFQGYAAVMDTLKSLADVGETKLLLIGSYDLADLLTNYAQVARRSEILHYSRYRIDDAADRKEFADVVRRLQQQWPCADVPNFSAISKELMEVTLGSVGLLKSLMQSALLCQLRADGERWNMEFLVRSTKSTDALRAIEKETLAGEENLANLANGRNAFRDPGFMSRVATRMAAPSAA